MYIWASRLNRTIISRLQIMCNDHYTMEAIYIANIPKLIKISKSIIAIFFYWSRWHDSNVRPHHPKWRILTNWTTSRFFYIANIPNYLGIDKSKLQLFFYTHTSNQIWKLFLAGDSKYMSLFGLFGESRTLTPSLAQEPKSCLSTNSNTKRYICACWWDRIWTYIIWFWRPVFYH